MKSKFLSTFAMSFVLMGQLLYQVADCAPAPRLLETPSVSWTTPNNQSVQGKVALIANASAASSGTGTISTWCLSINGTSIASTSLTPGNNTSWDYAARGGQSGNYPEGLANEFNGSTGCWSTKVTSIELSIDTTAWSDGSYSFVWKVTDSNGRSTTSPPETITTTNDEALPSVSWTTPNNQSVQGKVALIANASAASSGTGTISTWCLSINGTSIASTSLTPGNNTSWDYAALGGQSGNYPEGLANEFNASTGCWSTQATSIKLSIDTTAWPSGIYSFVWTATDSNGRSANSSQLTINTVSPSLQAIPTAPGNFVESIVNGVPRLSWNQPYYPGTSPITDYVIERSVDNKTWVNVDLHSTVTSLTPTFATGSGRFLRVAAVNSNGVGEPSAEIFAVGTGLAPQQIQVVTSTGQPVSGGSITWSAQNVRSSVVYGLTATGGFLFPAAPAGIASVTIQNATMPDGASVSGTFPVYLGLPSNYLVLPAEPGSDMTLVQVQTVNSEPVSNAIVSVDDQNVQQQVVVGNATFTAPQESSSGVSDAFGNSTIYGYIDAGSQVTVEYNDGVIDQIQSTPINSANVQVLLPYEPVIAPTSASTITSAGSLVSVTLATSESSPSTGPTGTSGGGIPLLRSHLLSRLTLNGIRVSAVLPAGYKSCVGQVLNGTTNSQGTVTFKFCASASGNIRFLAHGGYVHGQFAVFVKRTPPTSVVNLSSSSPSLGVAKLAWKKSLYDGGAPITGYIVTLASPGRKVLRSVVTSTSATFSSLAHATRYVISVSPMNQFGVGLPIRTVIGVA